jgi:hypothetical protein
MVRRIQRAKQAEDRYNMEMEWDGENEVDGDDEVVVRGKKRIPNRAPKQE